MGGYSNTYGDGELIDELGQPKKQKYFVSATNEFKGVDEEEFKDLPQIINKFIGENKNMPTRIRSSKKFEGMGFGFISVKGFIFLPITIDKNIKGVVVE